MHLCLSLTPQDTGLFELPQGFWEAKQRGELLGLISPQLGEGWDPGDVGVHHIHLVPEVASRP